MKCIYILQVTGSTKRLDRVHKKCVIVRCLFSRINLAGIKWEEEEEALPKE